MQIPPLQNVDPLLKEDAKMSSEKNPMNEHEMKLFQY